MDSFNRRVFQILQTGEHPEKPIVRFRHSRGLQSLLKDMGPPRYTAPAPPTMDSKSLLTMVHTWSMDIKQSGYEKAFHASIKSGFK
eukprot:1776506-Karenia_brevis.AAC.1